MRRAIQKNLKLCNRPEECEIGDVILASSVEHKSPFLLSFASVAYRSPDGEQCVFERKHWRNDARELVPCWMRIE